MKNPLDDWIELTREWLDEQMAEQRARDEAAWLRFRAALLGPLD
ncbi:hypothetical protein [Paraburkholderia caledonica]|uniref:Uncharacterized protein n=1 Tax=Paraburkholderia caledonica TaxID=134536 RepID=A0AB73IPZ4_9BURK|nr:hypothetical protein [Paraburkholderia caledonica]